MKKAILLLIASSLIGCTHKGPVNLNSSIAGVSMFNKDSTITNDITVDQKLINRVLTEEEKKQYREGVKEGKELYEKAKKGGKFIPPKAELFPISFPDKNFIGKFKDKNPKVCGVDRKITERNKNQCIPDDFILVLATAYRVFPHFLVFEGLRSEKAQRANVNKGVSKTMRTRHSRAYYYLGMAVDILAKDPRGKWSFKAVDRIGVAKGVILAAFIDLKSQGFLKCLEWEEVSLWRFRDAYHVQLNRIKGCGDKVTMERTEKVWAKLRKLFWFS